jgi:hypothetical protein
MGNESRSAKGRFPSRGYTITVYIGGQRKSQLEHLQSEWNLNASETVRLLLDYALEAVDKGQLKPETETITKAKAPAP